jgi:hypothetical protein
MIRKERTWKKDALDAWHFHYSLEAINRKWGIYFNWRPKSFIIHFDLSIHPSGLQIEFGLWFNVMFTVCFFNPDTNKNNYDNEDDEY